MSGVVALRLEVERRAAHDRVEEERLLERGDERVADPAQHRVEGPDRQVVLAALLECLRVVAKVLLGVVGIEPEAGCRERIDPPAPRLDVLRGHERERLRVPSLAVDQHRAVEDLQRLVRVERGHDLRQRAEVAVDELAEATSVVERPCPRAPGDEELEARRAERVLHVDDDDARSGSDRPPPARSTARRASARRRRNARRSRRARPRRRDLGSSAGGAEARK